MTFALQLGCYALLGVLLGGSLWDAWRWERGRRKHESQVGGALPPAGPGVVVRDQDV